MHDADVITPSLFGGRRMYTGDIRNYFSVLDNDDSENQTPDADTSCPCPVSPMPNIGNSSNVLNSLPMPTSVSYNGLASRPCSLNDISVLHVNIRGWRSHCDELSAYLNLLEQKPKLVAMNESFLHRSVLVALLGHVLVGRRDQDSSQVNIQIHDWGGIL